MGNYKIVARVSQLTKTKTETETKIEILICIKGDSNYSIKIADKPKNIFVYTTIEKNTAVIKEVTEEYNIDSSFEQIILTAYNSQKHCEMEFSLDNDKNLTLEKISLLS